MNDIAGLDRAELRPLFDLSSDVYATRGGGYTDDPYPTFHRMRETGPVHPGTPHEHLGVEGDFFFQGLPYPHRPHFTAYDFDTCQEILRDDTRFVTNVAPIEDEPELPSVAILFMDHTRHRSYRWLVQPSFVPKRAVWWLENWIRDTVEQLVVGFAGDGAADLNVELCGPVPLLTITGSFGISIEEALDVRRAVTSDGQGFGTLAGLLHPIILARREAPRDDLISVLVTAEMADEEGVVHRLSDVDVLAFSSLLLAAGSGTTWKQMGITINAFLRHPDALAAARADRGVLKAVVEESLRWQATDPAFSRFALVDTELAGVPIPAGSVVHANLAAANRDPSRWERPDEFDPFRPQKQHLGFGHGPHTCLGMHVARAEMTCALATLLDRLPDIGPDPNQPEPAIVGIYERGPTTVPVRWSVS